jgi:hypothetical protein
LSPAAALIPSKVDGWSLASSAGDFAPKLFICSPSLRNRAIGRFGQPPLALSVES